MRGESGWSSFAEREVKCIMDWLLRVVCGRRLLWRESRSMAADSGGMISA